MKTTVTVQKSRLSSGIYRGVLEVAPRNGRITATYLANRGACDTQVDKFKREWPNGMRLSRENIVHAGRLRFPLQWVQYTLLTDAANNATRGAFQKAKEKMDEHCRNLQERHRTGEITWEKMNRLILAAETRLRVKQANVLADVLGL